MIEENVFDKGGAQVLLAKEDGEPVGFALFFENFQRLKESAAFILRIWREEGKKRGKGYGKALFSAVMREAKIRGAGRMEWACLDWNKPSIDSLFIHGCAAAYGLDAVPVGRDGAGRRTVTLDMARRQVRGSPAGL